MPKKHMIYQYHFALNDKQLCYFISADYTMGEWEAWSTCSVTCGEGICTRHRECEGGKEGGKDCPSQEKADYKQTKPCKPKKCSGTLLYFYYFLS